ncbi:MAG: MG2 domain-containing protein [Tannerellaceae bacterium]|nr:MG2 domain-containing protein [Tannerellaceae bacterium]
MKRRAFVVFTLVLCCISAIVIYSKAAQTLSNKTMISQAVRNNDPIKVINTLLHTIKEQLEIDEDRYPELIGEVETYTATIHDAATRAILHSILAELYSNYYQQNCWRINQRTAIAGFIPADIREWSNNLFTQKITEEINASLLPEAILQQTPARRFRGLLQEGKDSPELRPTLYDLLLYRALAIQPTPQLYEQLLTFLSSQPNKKAQVLTELQYLQYKYNSRFDRQTQLAYLAALDSLYAGYQAYDFSVEILAVKSNLIQLYGNSASQDSLLAVEYRQLTEAIKNYPDYERIGIVKNRLMEVEKPILNVTQLPNNVYPEDSLKIALSYKNISWLQIRVYHNLQKPEAVTPYASPEKTGSTRGELVYQDTYTLVNELPWKQSDTILLIPLVQPGLYECEISSPGTTLLTSNIFSVSRLATVTRTLPGQQTEVLTTDFKTGAPLQGVDINYYTGKRQAPELAGTVRTDQNGLAVLPSGNDLIGYRPVSGTDQASLLTSLYSYGPVPVTNESRDEIALFTDRGIYRPGQTFFFKGIVYTTQDKNSHTINNREVTVTLRDVNNKEVATRKLLSNSFGSFNGEFTLPDNVLTGTFTLSTGNNITFIRVEAYKRPTFFIDTYPVKEEVSFGDSIRIQGKVQTFSGIRMQEGTLMYQIVQRPVWFRGILNYSGNNQVAQGEVNLQKDGSFSIPFQPLYEHTEANIPVFQQYEVITTFTDSKGETQEGRYTFTVGNTSFVLYADLPDKIASDSLQIIINARTSNNEQISVKGNYTIYPLLNTSEEGVYTEGNAVETGSFTSGIPVDGKQIKVLPSGRYRIRYTAQDSKRREVGNEQDFILYHINDKRPPVQTHVWLINNDPELVPGQTANVIFGTSDSQAYVLYELFAGNRRISATYHQLTNENQTFSIPWKESYGEGIVAAFTFVKEGKLYTTQTTIRQKQPDKKLNIKTETFRDRIQPGSQESWTLQVLNADSLPVTVEALAGMYDMSLDKISPFRWYFTPEREPQVYIPPFTEGNALLQSANYAACSFEYIKVPEYEFDSIEIPGSIYGGIYTKGIVTSGAGPMLRKSATDIATNSVLAEETITDRSANPEQEQPETPGQQNANNFPVRENFNETAFFYPSLLSDLTGKLTIRFQLPESNTSWKFQVLAHTSQLEYGYLSKEIVSSKELMVIPNLPRFIRKGDEAVISTQVVNNSGNPIRGRVQLELFDPITEQPVICLTKSQKAFELEAGETTTAAWTIETPENYDLIGFRITAHSDQYSDGEQHLIPVLDNRTLVTESIPYYLPGTGTYHIPFSLPEGASHSLSGMTIEYTDNPVWYAVEALPTLSQPGNQNIISWFGAYYSNILATSIVEAHPQLQAAIRQWSADGGNGTGLLSKLQQNEELKNVLLQETPWVLAAEQETERMQSLSLLFDINRSNDLRQKARNELIAQQNEDGGWGWYKGFTSDPRLTRFILKGMAQLTHLNAVEYTQEEKEIQIQALAFLDKQIKKEYDSFISNRNREQEQLSASQIDYLFVRSLYRDIPEAGDSREAIRYYTTLAENTWEQQPIYGKAQTAFLMIRNGQQATALQIMEWFRKTATTDPETGMYWVNNRRFADYFTSPIEVHTLIMELFHTLSGTKEENDRMKQWLLSQKRTQQWETIPATVNAIYELLLTGSDWLKTTVGTTLAIGDRHLRLNTSNHPAGYIKETIPANEIQENKKELIINKTGDTPAWGALYIQSVQPLDNIQQQQGTFTIEKNLFIETTDEKGTQIKPIQENSVLNVGDKIVTRITLRTDRTMEYVHLKDLRAGCFEPATRLSGSMYREGLWYYQSPGEVAENIFIDRLPQGTFILEYPVYVVRAGNYSTGITTVQCLYAPEFSAHTAGGRIQVTE